MSGRIETIVIPFDATSETRGAIALAARLAAQAAAQLHVPLSRTRICCHSYSSGYSM